MPTTKTAVDAPPGDFTGPSRVDEAIAGVEQLYQALTGHQPPPAGEEAYAPIPVEKDAAEFVTERLERLIGALGGPLGQPAARAGQAEGGTPAASRASTAGWSPPVTVLEDAEY